MKEPSLVFGTVIVLTFGALVTACTGGGDGNTRNSKPAQATATPSVASSPGRAAAAAPSPAGGVINVASTPPGAAVVLIREDEGASGNPERKGSTPVTITGLAPGKYSITLEKPGFRYFQKEVEVKDGKTFRIAASLKRE